jgi:hypothetical protein
MKRREAAALGLERYTTGKTCVRGHMSERNTSTGQCRECSHEYDIEWRAKNPERRRATVTKSRQKHKAHHTNYRRKWCEENRERVDALYATWKRSNPEKVSLYVTRRSSYVKNRMPAWANLEKMKGVYLLRDKLTAETGIQHHVDHIIPLNGLTVSGLHCEDNLQVLTEAQNLLKGNRI